LIISWGFGIEDKKIIEDDDDRRKYGLLEVDRNECKILDR
jgi:hypothetical protein